MYPVSMLAVVWTLVQHMVTKQTFLNEGVQVTVWDTPGLEGHRDIDRGYLEEIREKCADLDLFLYCVNSTEARATDLFDESHLW